MEFRLHETQENLMQKQQISGFCTASNIIGFLKIFVVSDQIFSKNKDKDKVGDLVRSMLPLTVV